jgi:hypothetical protein
MSGGRDKATDQPKGDDEYMARKTTKAQERELAVIVAIEQLKIACEAADADGLAEAMNAYIGRKLRWMGEVNDNGLPTGSDVAAVVLEVTRLIFQTADLMEREHGATAATATVK